MLLSFEKALLQPQCFYCKMCKTVTPTGGEAGEVKSRAASKWAGLHIQDNAIPSNSFLAKTQKRMTC